MNVRRGPGGLPSFHDHPDPALRELIAAGDPRRMAQGLASPVLRSDPFGYLSLLTALYRLQPGDEQLEWEWLQAMLLHNRPAAVWQVVSRWPFEPGSGFERLFLAAQVAQAAAGRNEARRRYRQLVSAFPDSVDGWQKWLEFEPGAALDAAGTARLQRFIDPSAPPYEREKACFALAAQHRSGAPEKAFLYAAEGQALKRERLAPWQPDAVAQQLQADRSAVVPTAPAPEQPAGPRPVFIVGLPRSGTTLLSAILSAHPMVSAAGEQMLVPALALGPARSAILAGHAGDGRFQAWYQAAIGDLAGSARAVVDKLPANAEHVGAILAAMPDALIVHIERDLKDTAVSIHMRDFDFGCGFARTPEHIGTYARQISDHLAHWRRRAPDRVLYLGYEALVADPVGTLAPVLERLGLEWDRSMDTFWQQPHQVATFSESQVQRPLNADGIGAWQRYQPAASEFLARVDSGFRSDAGDQSQPF